METEQQPKKRMGRPPGRHYPHTRTIRLDEQAQAGLEYLAGLGSRRSESQVIRDLIHDALRRARTGRRGEQPTP